MRKQSLIEQTGLMASSWLASGEGDRSEAFDFEVASPRRKPALLLRSKRSLVVGSVLSIFLFVLVLSRKYGTRGYFLREASDSVEAPDIQVSTEKAAVIVENRVQANLVPIIIHFASVLGPEWPIHVFTSKENLISLEQSTPFQQGLSEGRFHIRLLPPDTSLKTHASVSDFFTKPWFWEQLAPAEHLLLFQTDSILCSNTDQKVEDYFEYDFVGAPIDEERGLGMGYNGGLSLRSRSKSLEIVNKYSWQTERRGDHSHGNVDYEDQWFSKKMRELPPGPDGQPGANLPSAEVAMKFSVETMWYDRPLGYHQPNVWQAAHMDEVYRWCPEYRMCTTESFKDHNTEDFGSTETQR